MDRLNGTRISNGTPPLALYDASHGQPNWAQTGFPSREMHTNFAGVTEVLCRLGFLCRSTGGEPWSKHLAKARLLVVPPPTGRYDASRERWQRDRSTLLTAPEIRAVLDFLHTGGRLLAFTYRFGDSFTQTNLRDLFDPLGVQINDDAIIDVGALRSTPSLQMHFDIPTESLAAKWARSGVQTVGWRPSATFTIATGATAWPLALSTGGRCLSFDRTLRRICFVSLPIAVVGRHGAGRFALFGGPHVFESSPLGLLAHADNTRFLHHVLSWLLANNAIENRSEWLADSDLGVGDRTLTCVECDGEGKRAIASVERLLRKTGVLKALRRAQWMP